MPSGNRAAGRKESPQRRKDAEARFPRPVRVSASSRFIDSERRTPCPAGFGVLSAVSAWQEPVVARSRRERGEGRYGPSFVRDGPNAIQRKQLYASRRISRGRHAMAWRDARGDAFRAALESKRRPVRLGQIHDVKKRCLPIRRLSDDKNIYGTCQARRQHATGLAHHLPVLDARTSILTYRPGDRHKSAWHCCLGSSANEDGHCGERRCREAGS